MNATQDAINPASVARRSPRWPQTLEIGRWPAEADHAVPCQQICRRDWLRAWIEEVAQDLDSSDLRAAGSFWAKHYHAVLLSGVLPPLAMEGIGLLVPVKSAAMAFALRYPSRLCLSAHAIIPFDQPPSRTRDRVFNTLIDDHLERFIAAMSEAVGLSRRSLWADVGLRSAWLFQQIRQTADTTRHDAIEQCRKLLLETATRRWSRGRNPLAGTVRQGRDDGSGGCGLIRTTCCGTHRLPDHGYCSTCPLPAATALANDPGEAST